MDQQFYDSVLKRVKKIVYSIYPDNSVDPQEFISEAFIEGIPLDENFYVEWIIKKAGLKENKHQENEKEVDTSDRYCRACKQYYPSGYFRTWYLRGYLIHDSYCKECKNKIINKGKREKRKRLKELYTTWDKNS